MTQSIFPVIVLYNIRLADAPSYRTLLAAASVESFMVYDNSPATFNQDEIQLPDTAFYVRDTSNGGLSCAYNAGARLARERGYSHVLLLDQDTTFPSSLWQAYEQQLTFDGIVAPLMHTDSGMPFSPVRLGLRRSPSAGPGDIELARYGLVNSGCCIPVARYFEAGGYDERLRLDFADYQFQSRFRLVCPLARVLPQVAVQNFSGDCTDPQRVMQRYHLYLSDARRCRFATFSERFVHTVGVIRHAVALTVRMRSLRYLAQLFTRYFFSSNL